jgi:hypothetical protein
MPEEKRISRTFTEPNYFGEVPIGDSRIGLSRIIHNSTIEEFHRSREPSGDGPVCVDYSGNLPEGTTYLVKLRHFPEDVRSNHVYLKGQDVTSRMVKAIGPGSNRGLNWDLVSRVVETVFIETKDGTIAVGFYLSPEDANRT